MFHAIHKLAVGIETQKPITFSRSAQVHMQLPVLPPATMFGWLVFRVLREARAAVVPEQVELDHVQPGGHIEHCKSGTRSAIIWAAASARNRPVDEVLSLLSNTGFDLEFLRDELEEHALAGSRRTAEAGLREAA